MDIIDQEPIRENIISIKSRETGQMARAFNDFSERLHKMFLWIDESVNELTLSSAEMAKTADDFTEHSQRTATTAEEVTATVEEISANNHQVFDAIEYQH